MEGRKRKEKKGRMSEKEIEEKGEEECKERENGGKRKRKQSIISYVNN